MIFTPTFSGMNQDKRSGGLEEVIRVSARPGLSPTGIEPLILPKKGIVRPQRQIGHQEARA
jgi:hypothetical protein